MSNMHQLQKQADSILSNLLSTTSKNQQKTLVKSSNSSGAIVKPSSASDELILSRKQLTQFIIAMLVKRDQQLNSKAEEKDRIINQLREQLQRCQAFQIEQASEMSDNYQKEEQYREQFSQLTEKAEKYKRKKETLEKEAKWNQNKLKQQLREIQLLKQTVKKLEQKTKEKEIKQGQEKQKKDSSSIFSSSKADKSKPAAQVSQWSEAKISGKDSHTFRPFNIDSTKWTHPQLATPTKNNDFDSLAHNLFIGEGQKFYRHSDQDIKDRILRQLGQKCLFLESHIETLTHKLLGYILPSSSPYASPEKQIALHSFRPDAVVVAQPNKGSLVIDQEHFHIDID